MENILAHVHYLDTTEYTINSQTGALESVTAPVSTMTLTADSISWNKAYEHTVDLTFHTNDAGVAINAYVYEFPAGLVEPGEEMAQAGIREIYEETGLVFEPKVTEGAYTRPFFTTVGMTDESCGTIYGYCSGTPTNEHICLFVALYS